MAESTATSFRIPANLIAEFRAECERLGISQAQGIREALRQWLDDGEMSPSRRRVIAAAIGRYVRDQLEV